MCLECVMNLTNPYPIGPCFYARNLMRKYPLGPSCGKNPLPTVMYRFPGVLLANDVPSGLWAPPLTRASYSAV